MAWSWSGSSGLGLVGRFRVNQSRVRVVSWVVVRVRDSAGVRALRRDSRAWVSLDWWLLRSLIRSASAWVRWRFKGLRSWLDSFWVEAEVFSLMRSIWTSRSRTWPAARRSCLMRRRALFAGFWCGGRPGRRGWRVCVGLMRWGEGMGRGGGVGVGAGEGWGLADVV